MREIKFRAWNGFKFEHSIVAGSIGTFYVNPGERGDGRDSKDAACINPFNTDISFSKIEQYTGLKDKNGREIYEGDILGSKPFKRGERVTGVVAWTGAGWTKFWPLDEFEVIGNIHENPELVK